MGRRFQYERKKDRFYKAAQEEGLRSRAAFKLGFLATRFPVFHHGDRVLDLGAAPGGWSIVARDTVGPKGHVVAVDPRAIDELDGVEVVRGMVGDPRLLARLGPVSFDVVLSDMSPRISGAYATDHARSVTLVRSAFGLAQAVLADDGRFLAKVFDGDLLPELIEEMSPCFDTLRRSKPPASREHSSELYLIGIGFHPPTERSEAPSMPRLTVDGMTLGASGPVGIPEEGAPPRGPVARRRR
jgi:23S rRNA (uridine2552-2'-O)-methyltransferase